MPSNGRMARGLAVEPFGLKYYQQHVGPWWRPVPLTERWVVSHPTHEWASASPDAYDSPGGRVVVELKTQADPWARPLWGTPGTDQMATRYLYQAIWLISCANAERCHVLCLFGRDVEVDGAPDFIVSEPAVYAVDRDLEIENALLEYGERFMTDFVRPGIPPPVKPHANRREMKKRLTDERGADAVIEWEARCIEYAAANGQIGRGAGQGAEGDGAGDSVQNQPGVSEQVR